MKKSLLYTAAALVALVAISCKKDDNSTTTPSLGGLSLSGTVVPYLAVGETLTLEADVSDIYTSDDSTPENAIGMYWTVTLDGSVVQRDTTSRDIEVSHPKYAYTTTGLGKFTLTCYLFSSGYINSSSSVSFSVIDPENSLSGLSGKTQNIGGNKFYVTTIDGATWLANNLYGTPSGVSFYLSPVTDSFIGKFYSWKEALTACPEGWSLPSAAEWDALGTDACALMADAVLLEEQMWTYWPGMDITNAKGFNAIPAGYVDLTGGQSNVQGFMDYAIFWTASPSEEDGDLAEYRYIYADKNIVQKGFGSKESLALPVRCIKD